MQVVLKPVIDQVLDAIEKYGPENLLRIDLDELQFGNLYKSISSKGPKSPRSFELGATSINMSKSSLWKGSYCMLNGVCVQCSYK